MSSDEQEALHNMVQLYLSGRSRVEELENICSDLIQRCRDLQTKLHEEKRDKKVFSDRCMQLEVLLYDKAQREIEYKNAITMLEQYARDEEEYEIWRHTYAQPQLGRWISYPPPYEEKAWWFAQWQTDGGWRSGKMTVFEVENVWYVYEGNNNNRAKNLIVDNSRLLAAYHILPKSLHESPWILGWSFRWSMPIDTFIPPNPPNPTPKQLEVWRRKCEDVDNTVFSTEEGEET